MRADSRCLIAAVLSAFSFSAFEAEAQLAGGRVVAGQATISSPSATSTLIHQTSPSAIINWSGFSIPSGSLVTFQQPSASAIALNRVTGGSVSQIYGTLTANGRVWLINPNGIVLGPSAQVSAAGVLLSTMGIRDQDFLSGNYTFGIPGDPNAAIVNEGRIVATSGGSVILAAPRVRNDGLIEADLGTVVLAGAKTVTVDFAGDDLLKFAVPSSAVDTVAPGTDALVSNGGTIAAPGGRVLLTAAAAKGVLDNVINTSGIVEATSVAAVNGKIVLSASGGSAQVSGTLDASGKDAGQTGGAIEVLGNAVRLASGARLDASGDAGGGTVLAGGNFHGAGPEPNAQATVVEAGALIDASALTRGDGGRVAVWSDGSTRFEGAIRARGGASGGNGGYVETSGSTLWNRGTVDTRAPFGHVGMWLLDPVGVEICNTCSTSPGSIISNLSTTDVAIQSVDDILVTDPVVYNSAQQLNLLSQANIDVNASIQNAGTGALNLFAGWDGSTGLAGSTFSPATAISGNAFGIGGLGDVHIGNGTQFGGIAVGSADGITTAAAANLTVRGSDQNVTNSFAQLGFYGGGGAPIGASGDITVALTGSLSVIGGNPSDASNNYAQVGHGGRGTSTSNSGNISITAAGGVTLLGGGAFEDYAQIGHGGADSNNSAQVASISQTGAIAVTATDVTLTGGGGDTGYAQIGHGGFDANFSATVGGGTGSVTLSGDITVNASNLVSLTSPNNGTIAYAQIGHGGLAANAGVSGNIDVSGNITVAAAGLTLTGGNAGSLVPDYAQIGHGGFLADQGASTNHSITGTIQVTVGAGGATLSGGSAAAQASDYAQIGHGDAMASADSDASGDIIVHVAGTTTLTSTLDAPAFIGNLAVPGNTVSGNVAIISGTLVDSGRAVPSLITQDILGGNVLLASTGPGTVTIGNAGSYSSPNDLTLLFGGGAVFNDSIQNRGTGAINVVAGWDGSSGLVAGQPGSFSAPALLAAANSYGKAGGDITIGDGTQTFSIVVGSLTGATTVAARNLLLNAGFGADGPAAAQIGFNTGGGTGDITVATTGSITLNGGTGPSSAYAQIGYGGEFESIGSTGNITVKAGSDVTLNAGAGNDAYAQIGHGGAFFNGSNSGIISVTVTGNLILNGSIDSGGSLRYAQIGHGGVLSQGSQSGPIIVVASGTVQLNGGAGTNDDYAQIGHGGGSSNQSATSSFSLGGTIDVTAANVALEGGTGLGDYAQIGHGGYFSGDQAGVGAGSIVLSGDITVTANSALTLAASGTDSYAQIGHGGNQSNEQAQAASVTDSGNLSIVVGAGGSSGVLTMTGGTGGNSYAQIGHGGFESSYNASPASGASQTGTISVTVNGAASSATLTGGSNSSGFSNYAQIGHGDPTQSVTGNEIGDITVHVGGATTIANGPSGAIAFIGNGNLSGTGSVTGNVGVTSNAIVSTGGALEGSIAGVIGGGNVTIQSLGSGTFALPNAINYSSANPLALSALSGTLVLGGGISNAGAGSVTLSGNSVSLGQKIATQGGLITVNGNVLLAQSFTVDSTNQGAASNGATIDFSGSIDGTGAGGQSLTMNAGTSTVTVSGPIGGSVPLGPIQITGGLIDLDGRITTKGGNVTLNGATSFANGLAIDTTAGGTASAGVVTFSQGGSFNLNGGQFALGGAFSFPSGGFSVQGTGDLLIGPGTSVVANGPITIGTSGSLVHVDGQGAGGESLSLNAGGSAVSLFATLGGSVPLGTFTVTGSSITLGGSASTTGSQTYNGPVTVSAVGATISGLNLTFASTIDGPGGLSLIDAVSSPGTISVAGDIGSTTPLASFSALGGTIILNGSVITTGSQTYTDSLLVLDPSNPSAVYQTDGAAFTQNGSTVMGGSPGFGSPSTIVIDTTGGGSSPAGGPITFASPGDISGGAALSFQAGSGGAISVGVLGLFSVNVLSGASFTFLPPAPPVFTCPVTICIPPEVDVTDTNLQQQLVAHLPGTTLLLDFELPPATLGFSPPLPIFLTASGPGSGPDSSTGGDGTMLTSVVDLDTGSQLFSQISPNSGGTSEENPDPLTILQPITPAPQPVPPPQTAEEPVGGAGGTLFHARTIIPNLPGIPGVDQPSLGAGNRGLWFAAPAAP